MAGQTTDSSDTLTTTTTYKRFEKTAPNEFEVTRAENDIVHVYVKVAFQGTPNNNVIVRIVTSPGIGGTPDFENAQTPEFLIENTTTNAYVYLGQIEHGKLIRFEAKEDGGTAESHQATIDILKDTRV